MTADKLRALNKRFYDKNHSSFSQSRHAAWPGWKRVQKYLTPSQGAFRILDVACGNLRFERFLVDGNPSAEFKFTCLDSCVDLMQPCEGADLHAIDVIRALLNTNQVGGLFMDGAYDGAVCFGFFHHVPGMEARERLLDELVRSVVPRGYVIVSLWCFARDDKLKCKAHQTTVQALEALEIELDEGDYVLGWNGCDRAYRYCHSFSEEDIDLLADQVCPHAVLVERFDSDGRTGNLNTYLVFRKR